MALNPDSDDQRDTRRVRFPWARRCRARLWPSLSQALVKAPAGTQACMRLCNTGCQASIHILPPRRESLLFKTKLRRRFLNSSTTHFKGSKMVPRAWPALCGPARGRPLGPLLPLRGGASPEGGLRGSARPPCARQGPARSLARAGAVRPGRLLIGAGRRGPRDRGERRAAALPGSAGGGALRVFNATPEVPPFTRRPDAHGAVPVGTRGRVPALRVARNHALLGL